MIPGDRLVCAFVRPQTTGMQFKKWLLHVTIVPWFRLEDESADIAGGLEQALKTISPFEARVDGAAKFGPRRREVSLVKQPTGLNEVEAKVRGYLHKKRAWLVDETTKRRYDFRPHVTMQGDEKLQDGDTFWVDRLYIVEQKGDYKEIVAEVNLGE